MKCKQQWHSLLQTTPEMQGMVKQNAFNVKLSIIQRLPRLSLCILEKGAKGVFEIQESNVTRFFMNGLGFALLELGFLHWHGVHACPQIPPPCY